MKKIILLAGLLLVVGASMASAAGLNLAWNECIADPTAAQNANFACNVNTGSNSAVASFFPPAGVNEFLGLSSQVDITTQSATLPDWWAHGGTFCRGTTGFSVSFDFTSATGACTDFFSGQAAGGFVYDVGYGQPNRARVRIQCAIPFDNRGPIAAATEYYAFKMNILHSKTVSGCAGCDIPACIVLNEIQLFQPPADANDPVIQNPATRNWVTWQNATTGSGAGVCPQSTPTHSHTWGEVKSLYR